MYIDYSILFSLSLSSSPFDKKPFPFWFDDWSGFDNSREFRRVMSGVEMFDSSRREWIESDRRYIYPPSLLNRGLCITLFMDFRRNDKLVKNKYKAGEIWFIPHTTTTSHITFHTRSLYILLIIRVLYPPIPLFILHPFSAEDMETRVSDLVKNQALITLWNNDTVAEALDKLGQANISSAPVIDQEVGHP